MGLLILAAAVFGLQWGFDALVGAPWAHSIGGRPTLTGRWTGNVDNPPDDVLVLEIIRGSGRSRLPDGTPNPRSRDRMFDYTVLGHHPTLHGTAVWCRPNGTVSRYTVSGWATSGGDVAVTFTLPIPPTRSGTELREMHGHWSGSALVLSGPLRLYVIAPGRQPTTQPATTATTVTLHPIGVATDSHCSL